MKLFGFVLATTIFLLLLGTTQTNANEIVITPENSSYVSGEILIKFRSDTPENVSNSILRMVGAKEQGEISQIGVKKLKVSEHAMQAVIETLNRNPNVEFAEPSYIAVVTEIIPNDPLYSTSQWAPQKVEAPEAWSITIGTPEVVVAVLDTGVNSNHPDLIGQLTRGFDVVNNDDQPDDDYWADEGHGTPVTGIISAATNNGEGIASIAWNTPVMPVKVCDSDGRCSHSNIATGIIYAVDNGAKVINMSFGSIQTSTTLELAIQYAWNNNSVLVAAAGNCGCAQMRYPSKYPGVVGVGSSDQSDQVSWFTSYGSQLDLLAPGNFIISTTKDEGYGLNIGTSFSSPHVAAAAALLWSVGASNNSEVVEALIRGADDLEDSGWDELSGWGRLNIHRSLQSLIGDTPSPTPTPTVVPTPTATVIPTPTVTPTPTSTIAPTSTPTIEPTNTPDPTPTETSTQKPTKPPKKTPKGWGKGGKPR